MRGRHRREVPACLTALEQRFVVWRGRRDAGARIPEPLWKAAAKVARECGVHATAKRLRLDYYALKKRAAQCQRNDAAMATFVDITPPVPLVANECVLELESGDGRKLRIQWRGAAVPEVSALSQAFWDGP